MPIFHIVVLALIQGITEFLPISSSAHLVLVPVFTGWKDQGLVMDVAVHVGTLLAVILYFRRDMAEMIVGGLKLLIGRVTPGGRLALLIVVSTIPVVLAGAALHELAPDAFRGTLGVKIIAWTTLLFGILLWIADRFSIAVRRSEHLKASDAVLIGIAQAVALLPGVSRSGITMTAGRALGMERSEAARFSLLMAIPTIIAAGVLEGMGLYESGNLALGIDVLLGAAFAFVSALAAIALMMRWLEHASFTPFVIYRIVLGAALLYWLYG
ncbi:MAG TPA: undecaprenyl-diphosphate phosphatase [Alphaproteobacteria bacterium]|nr:undecaprenyl-diphosphate phosphatase [Alphaproteobacteria bacterium]